MKEKEESLALPLAVLLNQSQKKPANAGLKGTQLERLLRT